MPSPPKSGSQLGRAQSLFASALLTLLGVLVLTGLALSFTFSPSTTHAWSSVAYLEREVPLGHFVRALHHDATHLLILVGIGHLLLLALSGAPRQRPAGWIARIGAALLALLLAHTGLLLPADGRAFAAAHELFSITASVPLLGGPLTQLLRGGPSYGHLTLVHLGALHTLLLPLAFAGCLARVMRARPLRLTVPGGVVALVTVLGCVLFASLHGAPLWAPGDPARAFPARPEWFLLPIFQLRRHLGRAEALATVGVPALLVLAAVALTWMRRSGARWLVGLIGLSWIALSLWAVQQDAHDAQLHALRADARLEADDALRLSALGTPEGGPLLLDRNDPVVYGRHLFAQHCESCHHGADETPYQGDVLLQGYGSRAWLQAFLAHPRSPYFFGNGKIDGMDPVPAGSRRDALVEYLVSLARPQDADPGKARDGERAFAEDCQSCHTVDGKGGAGAPDLRGYGSEAWLGAFIRNPGGERFYGDDNEMERFASDQLSEEELRAVLAYVRSRGQQPLNIVSPAGVEGTKVKAEESSR